MTRDTDERGKLDAYIKDWARIIWDATGDQTKVDRAILLADLNGMFDPAKFAASRTPAGHAEREVETGPVTVNEYEAALSNAPAPSEGVRDIRETAANAIRTFCRSLGSAAVQISSDGVERIYYAGISLDALSVAVALALTIPAPADTEDQGPDTLGERP